MVLVGIQKCFVILVISILISCGRNEEKKPIIISKEELPGKLEKVNKKLSKTEDDQIRDLVKRYGWKMEETGTGLRIMIYKKGEGLQPKNGNSVKINFNVKLINGNVVYSSKEEGPREFLLGRSDEISGLHEALLLMHVGDKAKLIVPSHLAFGLMGDDEKIPKRATLIYDVELLELR